MTTTTTTPMAQIFHSIPKNILVTVLSRILADRRDGLLYREIDGIYGLDNILEPQYSFSQRLVNDVRSKQVMQEQGWSSEVR